MSTKINNGLFMGDVDAAQDAEFISLNGIEFIVNCVSREVPNVYEGDGIEYMMCDMAEDPECVLFDLRNQNFVDLVQFIENAMEQSHSLLVHSMDGLSRSPCVMMSYLMVKYLWSLDKAFDYVKMKRADINPHHGYLEQLSSLDLQLQKKYGSCVPDKKRNDWDPLYTDPKSDELVLVNTYLNVISTSTQINEIINPKGSSKKKQLQWLDLCPHLRKLHPNYDFSKLERPPSASYSSLSAGNGWIDLEPPGIDNRPVTEVDLTISDEESDHEQHHKPDSWDLSYSDPGIGHDMDSKQCKYQYKDSIHVAIDDRDDEIYKPQTIAQRHRSIPSHHVTKSVVKSSNKKMDDEDLQSQNQHSPTLDNPPRYLQHTKSSRNAKLVKLPQEFKNRRSSMPIKTDAETFRYTDKPPTKLPSTGKSMTTSTVKQRPRTAPISKSTKGSLMQNVMKTKGTNAINPIQVTSTKPRPPQGRAPVYGWGEKKAPKKTEVKPTSTRQTGNRVTPAKWR
ncbi:hypothetical protein THRCLA_01802 [Thraustotheca clavata]|uniref:Tyrosine-protein phosphatase domain-containing protein n=1 Tax=Thraustotheca clavata TaxID=74557 RepID=A0A1W0A773_9STRA|nr:hypothetical protein THRCLA_01802 [Thraustotheca clavata]